MQTHISLTARASCEATRRELGLDEQAGLCEQVPLAFRLARMIKAENRMFSTSAFLFDGAPTPRLDKLEVKGFLDSNLPGVISYIDPFRPPNSSDDERRKTFCGTEYADFVEKSDLAFLNMEDVVLPSLYSPGLYRSIASELPFDRFRVNFFTETNGDPCILVSLAKTSLFHFNIQTNVVTYTNPYRENTLSILRGIISVIYLRGGKYNDYFERAFSERRRAMIIGDERPTHFLRQSMGYIEAYISRNVVPFLNSGGELWINKDRAVVDPVKIFPELMSGTVTYISDAEATLNPGRGIQLVRRYYRSRVESLTWLERLKAIQNPRSPDGFMHVLLSIDAEKSRFLNQEFAIQTVVTHLESVAGASGKRLALAVDGWTLRPYSRDRNDTVVLSRIGDLLNKLKFSDQTKVRRIYDELVSEKMAAMAHCEVAICPHGTAALLPSRALKIPTVTFHVSENMKTKDDVDPEFHVPVQSRFITEHPGSENKPAHRREFSVDPQGIIEALNMIAATSQDKL